MQERFSIVEIYICPVYREGNSFKLDSQYPTRYCVVDEEREIAIDIKTKLKYDYVRTMSHLYFISQSYEKIKGDKRVAIFPFASISYDKYDINEAKNIIERLKNNEVFKDGNDVHDNHEYLEYLKQETIKETNKVKKDKSKTKKFGKRKK